MKKAFLITLSFLFLASPLAAQNNVKKAQKILKQTSKHYKGMKSLKADFTVTIEDPQSKSKTTESGTLYTQGQSFKVELKSEEIICDGKTIWNWQKEINEIQIKDYKPAKNDIQPSNIFTIYNEGFDYNWVSQSTENGVLVDEIELAPKDKNSEIAKVKLKIDSKKDEIVSAWIRKKNGMTTTYSIRSFAANPTLSAGFFKMDVASKKGAEVIDLRKHN